MYNGFLRFSCPSLLNSKEHFNLLRQKALFIHYTFILINKKEHKNLIKVFNVVFTHYFNPFLLFLNFRLTWKRFHIHTTVKIFFFYRIIKQNKNRLLKEIMIFFNCIFFVNYNYNGKLFIFTMHLNSFAQSNAMNINVYFLTGPMGFRKKKKFDGNI